MSILHHENNQPPRHADLWRHPGRADRRRPFAFGVLVVFVLTLAVPCLHCFAMASSEAGTAVVAAPEPARMPAAEMPADMPADCPMHQASKDKAGLATPPVPEPVPSSGSCADPGACCLTPGALPPTPQTLDVLHASPLAVPGRAGHFTEMLLPARQDAAQVAGDERSHAPPAFPLPLRI